MRADDRSTSRDWLTRRDYADLPPAAERALRAAGLAWHDEAEAERQLACAEELAPGHLAVLVAHYRYLLYKHRFAEALPWLERCCTLFLQALGKAEPARALTREDCARLDYAPDLRAWLFARQAYGYLLIRLGRESDGVAVLDALVALDPHDQTKSRILLEVVARAGQDDEANDGERGRDAAVP